MTGIQDDAYLGQMDSVVPESFFNSLVFLINQIVNGNWTITLGLVKAVHGGGTGAPPTVDVQPMVSEIDGYGNLQEHGTIYGLPVFRLQGGPNGIIADPAVDDIGILLTASRDISSVIKNKAPGGQGSWRTFDPADGIFIGGLLGVAALTQYLYFTDTGLQLVDKNGNSFKGDSSGITVTDASGNKIVTSATGVTITDVNSNQMQMAAGHVNFVTPVLQVNGVPVTVP